MALCLTIFGSALMFTAPSFVPEHVTVGFFVALLGVIISLPISWPRVKN